MSIHWQDLDTTGKITAIQSIWSDGMSAAQIAAHFQGATRRAVIGMYDRWRDDLAKTPLRPPLRQSNVVRVPREPRRRAKPRATASAPPKAKLVRLDEQQLAGIPMVMLRAHRCKFAVNEADVGETHLFCGLPADGAFCAHHHGRVYHRQHLDRET